MLPLPSGIAHIETIDMCSHQAYWFFEFTKLRFDILLQILITEKKTYSNSALNEK